MMIAIPTTRGGLKDTVCPMFGRCPTFTIVDVDEKAKKIGKASVIPNPGAEAFGGAGMVAAQTIADSGANIIITGNCGPNAFAVLAQAGVAVYLSKGGTVENAIMAFLNGELTPLQAPSVPGHFGMGRGMGRGGGRFGGGGRGRFGRGPP